MNSEPATDNQHCKDWCASQDDCGGFTLLHGTCHFKGSDCKDEISSLFGAVLYLKQSS